MENLSMSTKILLLVSFICHASVYDDHNYDLWSQVENVIVKCKSDFNDPNVLIMGDLNARIGTENDFIENDTNMFIPVPDNYDTDDVLPIRKSKDKTVNNFGRKLLDFCKTTGMRVLNGRTKGDEEGNFTFISHTGKSVVDHALSSVQFLCTIVSFTVGSNPESDHMPITTNVDLKINSSDLDSDDRGTPDNTFNPVKYFWNSRYKDSFIRTVQSLISDVSKCVQYDNVNECVNKLCDVFYAAGKAMKCKQRSVKGNVMQSNSKPWYDDECKRLKLDRNDALTKFRHSNSENDLDQYLLKKRFYKSTCKRKKSNYMQDQGTMLQNAIKSNQDLWNVLSTLKPKSSVADVITATEWFNYFRSLYSQETTGEQNLANCVVIASDNDGSILNNTITDDEVAKAISQLKTGKSAGIDGIPGEMFKCCSNILVPFITKIFNDIFVKTTIPDVWKKGIIVPIHKKGSLKDPNNYRAISLLPIFSKLFTSVLNTRLMNWANEFNIITEIQAGFRKGYSTTDHIFALYTIIHKYLRKKRGRLFCVFVDFRKAFDLIRRDKLWYKLKKLGIDGYFLDTIQQYYEGVSSCVRTYKGCTEFFDCKFGLRQGCNFSPQLFSFFINGLIDHFNQENIRGIQINDVDIPCLMYADDIVLFADAPFELQNMLNALSDYCDMWDLEVNLEKTKAMVFRNGGIVKRTEKWFYKNKEVEVVPYYNYLGVKISSRGSWSVAINTLANQASKSLFKIKSFTQVIPNLKVDIKMYLFDTLVTPILLYGSEVWGQHDCQSYESIQTKYCKNASGIPYSATNNSTRAELGRFPLQIKVYKKMISYWFKILQMNPTRIPLKCYTFLKRLDDNGVDNNWVSKIRRILNTHGFGFVWLNQGVENHIQFLSIFEQRCKDIYCQNWRSETDSHNRRFYLNIKTGFDMEEYIKNVTLFKHRRCITLIRTCSHNLNFNNRCQNPIDGLCRLCDLEEVEDEFHFCLVCPAYSSPRENLLPSHSDTTGRVQPITSYILFCQIKMCLLI